jgi:hypothetical protein
MSYKDVNYIRYDWVSDDPKMVSKAEELAELWRAEKLPKRKNKRPFDRAFNVILTAMEVLEVYAGNLVHIPVNNNLYKGKTKRSSAYTTVIYDSLVWLIDHNYLDLVEGVKFTSAEPGEDRVQIPRAYKLSDKWLKVIASQPLSDPSLIQRNESAVYVELRKKVRKQIRMVTPSSEELEAYGGLIEATEKLLRDYDDLMSEVVITLGAEPVTSAKASMTRIFNNASFESGGRLYSQIQSSKKVQRPHLYFDGEPTIEIDFGAIHPNLLYHKEGETFAGNDPYMINGFDRETVKTAFNTMINRGGKHKAKSAVKALVHYLQIDIDRALELEAAILDLHKPIGHYFNSGYGLKLQRLDSDIAMNIIDYFIYEERRPIIGVHDSFIVSVRDTETLKLLMNDQYNKMFEEQNDAVFDAIDWSSVVEVDGVVGLDSIKATSLDFSKELKAAIAKCFEGNTDEMDDKFWDDLLAKEAVQDFSA